MQRIRSSMLAACAIVASVLVPTASRASTTQWTYATMSDGVKIALCVNYPAGANATDTSHDWPALFVMDGYDGGAGCFSTATYGRERYVVVHASIRGTGCSGGSFDLFDRRMAFDGKEIIDNFIPAQGWSNGRVGIIGHSYAGLTGFLVASTQPQHLVAMTVSGLIDDLYRGIVYPGGVPNYGFPAVWTGVYRPESELAGNAARYEGETAAGDPTCALNIATRPPASPLDNPIANGVAVTDSQWFVSHSLMTFEPGVKIPTLITQQYQDEQTGPRGGHVLWQHLPVGVPKRLELTNGVHATNGIANADKNDWLDCWILFDGIRGLDAGNGRDSCASTMDPGHYVNDPARRVQVHFETQSGKVNAPLVSSDWPLPQTDWTRYYFRANGALSATPGGANEGATSYVSLPDGRQTAADAGGLNPAGGQAGALTYVAGPDEASYSLDFGADTAIAGPILLTLQATSTAADTDFFVDVMDQDSAGNLSYLQRGMQRASHRAVDFVHSDYIAGRPRTPDNLYRVYEPHSTIVPVTPGAPTTYYVEVFPVGWVFRAGHKMIVKIHTPPPADPLSIYAWISAQPPAVNTIIQAGGASSILLPVLPSLPPLGDAPACGAQTGVPCFKPVA
jgi:predicted acyl esterase